jgi:hypothetical protein
VNGLGVHYGLTESTFEGLENLVEHHSRGCKIFRLDSRGRVLKRPALAERRMAFFSHFDSTRKPKQARSMYDVGYR